MTQFKILFSFFSLLVCASLSYAETKPTIYWTSFDLPPIWLPNGPYKGQGIVDFQRDIYIQNMPEFEHKEMTVTIARFGSLGQEKDRLYCNAGQTVPRGAIPGFLWSDTPYMIPPNYLIMRKTDLAKIPLKDGKASLENLLKDQKLTLAITPGRNYGGTIDAVLKKYDSNPRLIKVGHRDNFATLKMLNAKRIDAVIEYPFTLPYLAKVEKIKEEFDYVRVIENDRHYPYFVMCNDHKDAPRAIAKINKLIKKYHNDPMYQKGVRLWYPAKLRKEFEKVNGLN